MKTALFLWASTLAIASTAYAHFTLDYPYTRGFDEDKESSAPCGGFDTPNATLTPWCYLGGPVKIDSHHDTATVQIFVAHSKTASLSEFKSRNLTAPLSLHGEGDYCFKVNASSVGHGKGSQAIIMVEHISTHGHLYQCSDVTFSADTSLGASMVCTGALTAQPSSDSHHDGHMDSPAQTNAAAASNGSVVQSSTAKSAKTDAGVSSHVHSTFLSCTVLVFVAAFMLVI